jgi:hypothetical protein
MIYQKSINTTHSIKSQKKRDNKPLSSKKRAIKKVKTHSKAQ